MFLLYYLVKGHWQEHQEPDDGINISYFTFLNLKYFCGKLFSKITFTRSTIF